MKFCKTRVSQNRSRASLPSSMTPRPKITAGINLYSSDIEMYLDKALKESRVAGSLNPNGPPDLTFAVKCLIEEHQVTSDLNKGFFTISGAELGKLSPRQMAAWPDSCVTSGCGYEGCNITLID
mgnify:CR=1 FL=1